MLLLYYLISLEDNLTGKYFLLSFLERQYPCLAFVAIEVKTAKVPQPRLALALVKSRQL